LLQFSLADVSALVWLCFGIFVEKFCNCCNYLLIILKRLAQFSPGSWVNIQQSPPLGQISRRCPFNSYEDNKSLVRNIATAVQKYPEKEKYVDNGHSHGRWNVTLSDWRNMRATHALGI
jgi:hypothetical protein